MILGPAQKLLDTAAAPTLERIRRDRQTAPPQIQPLLAHLENHLFDPDLDANQLKRACGVRDNSLPIYFHHALSRPPYAYIEDCRLEVACRLLGGSDLKIWQIAQMLGYSTLQVFSRAFQRWSGVRPSVYRRRARQESQDDEDVAQHDDGVPDDGSLISMDVLRRASNGALSRDEADDLSRRLARSYPDSFYAPGASRSAAAGGGGATTDAAQAWSLLEEKSADERRAMVEKGVRVASVELFELLQEKSRDLGREDRDVGLELAELALACLSAGGDRLNTARRRELEALGWAWLGHARRLALDFGAAEEAFAMAMKTRPARLKPELEARVLVLQCALRTSQHRFDEALELIERAGRLHPAESRTPLAAEILLARASIHDHLDQYEEGIPDLRLAREILEQFEPSHLLAEVYQKLAVFALELGAYREAERYLPRAKELCESLGLERMKDRLEWNEGMVAQGLGQFERARAHFGRARQRFNASGELYESALVALDLAIVAVKRRDAAEVLELCSEAIPIFETFKIRREALAALGLLQQAVASREVALSTLKKARSSLERR